MLCLRNLRNFFEERKCQTDDILKTWCLNQRKIYLNNNYSNLAFQILCFLKRALGYGGALFIERVCFAQGKACQ